MKEQEVIDEAFMDALESSVVHQILRAQNETMDYEMVVNIMRETFYAGYLTRRNGPLRVTETTKDRLYMTVLDSVDGLLETFYDIEG